VARARDLSWKQLGEHRAALLEKIDDLGKQEEEAEEQLRAPGAPSHLEKHAVNLKQARETLWGGIHQIDAELQMRPALSFGCLCFVLIGCPVGIWFSRSDYLSAFITCFLPIVFVYYPLMLCGTGMAKEGRFNMVPLVWGADAVVGLIGVVLFWRLLRN
jgi:lipopolysaccharide export system permease protein